VRDTHRTRGTRKKHKIGVSHGHRRTRPDNRFPRSRPVSVTVAARRQPRSADSIPATSKSALAANPHVRALLEVRQRSQDMDGHKIGLIERAKRLGEEVDS